MHPLQLAELSQAGRSREGLTMPTFDEDSGELEVKDDQRECLARAMKIAAVLAKHGKDGGAEARRGLEKLVAAYPVKAAK